MVLSFYITIRSLCYIYTWSECWRYSLILLILHLSYNRWMWQQLVDLNRTSIALNVIINLIYLFPFFGEKKCASNTSLRFRFYTTGENESCGISSIDFECEKEIFSFISYNNVSNTFTQLVNMASCGISNIDCFACKKDIYLIDFTSYKT